MPQIHRRDDRAFLERAQAGMKAGASCCTRARHRDDMPMKPQVVATR